MTQGRRVEAKRQFPSSLFLNCTVAKEKMGKGEEWVDPTENFPPAPHVHSGRGQVLTLLNAPPTALLQTCEELHQHATSSSIAASIVIFVILYISRLFAFTARGPQTRAAQSRWTEQ